MNIEKIESIAGSSKVMVVVLDSDLKYVYVNDAHARVSGLNREQAIGKTNAQLFGSLAARQWDEADRRSLKSDNYKIDHTEWRDASGKLRQFMGTRLRMKSEGKYYMVALVTEIPTNVPSPLDEAAADLRGMILAVANLSDKVG